MTNRVEEIRARLERIKPARWKPPHSGDLEYLLRIAEAARNLYDNRLGHRDDNPAWHSPQSFWRGLGAALDDPS